MLVYDMAAKSSWNMIEPHEVAEIIRSGSEKVRLHLYVA